MKASSAARAPHPGADNEFVRTIERMINNHYKTQTEIASEIGYDNHNMITMFKTGRTRVPMDKVLPLSEAVDADGATMLSLWFETYMPGALTAIERVFGRIALTARERSWLHGLRRDYAAEDLPVYKPELLRFRAHAD